ncbi:MAG TPA: hypothetical protein VND91_06720 [Candidatus Saccharimonadia bacterium]|nr:hypothetical protein [Candidatus Saccharimonadia bacterium]
MTIRKTGWTLAAAGLALAAGTALATDDAFERMTYNEFRLMLRDAHMAYQREDHAKAFELYSRNACTGDKGSQFALGSMYLFGEGTQADGMKAYAWLASAAEAREPRFQSEFRKLDQVIPSEHRDAAKRAADDVIARYGMHATNVSCSMRAEAGTKIASLDCKPPVDPRSGYVEIKRCEA